MTQLLLQIEAKTVHYKYRGALETLNGENAKASATKHREITSLNIIEVDLR